VQVLTPADEIHHINKHNFKVPFVCGCRDLGEALRRIAEGAAMIRTKVSSLIDAGGEWLCTAAGMHACLLLGQSLPSHCRLCSAHVAVQSIKCL
jgi:NaMN:DMB phosphoribosyltransferase